MDRPPLEAADDPAGPDDHSGHTGHTDRTMKEVNPMPDDALEPSPLDPADEARVRRLLAEARHVGPLPDDVAHRLDGALARLVEERSSREAERNAFVVDLASRRRRRRIATALVAAAATVVLGVSLPSLTGGLSLSDRGADGGAEGGADEAGTSQPESAAEGREFEGGDSDGSADPSLPSTEAAPLTAPAEVTADRFKRDAAEARDQAPAYHLSARAEACGDVPVDAAAVVPVTYGGRDGLLVFDEPSGERQRVDLYLCPEGELVRSATVAAP